MVKPTDEEKYVESLMRKYSDKKQHIEEKGIEITDIKNSNELNELQACWEFMHCPKEEREKCEAYKHDFGKKCWLMTKSVMEGCAVSNTSCFNCLWYKKNKP